MPAPYQSGDMTVFLEDVPDGIKVSRAEVQSVTEQGDRWLVTTDRGAYTVGEDGRGGRLWPSDEEFVQQFAEQGDGFVARWESTGVDEQDLGEGTDRMPDDMAIAERDQLLGQADQITRDAGNQGDRGHDIKGRGGSL